MVIWAPVGMVRICRDCEVSDLEQHHSYGYVIFTPTDRQVGDENEAD